MSLSNVLSVTQVEYRGPFTVIIRRRKYAAKNTTEVMTAIKHFFMTDQTGNHYKRKNNCPICRVIYREGVQS